MVQVKKPVELPDSKVINTLIEKANSKTDYEFNYIHELDQIRNRISIEVSRINLLFPEYTPHDEKYHLKRLFFVADQMLGDDVIENMNVTELFLLSVSLYAHDWGMAISEEEKTHILSISGDSIEGINLLDDEKVRIKEFCKSKNVEIKDIEISDWQEYVRLTHAFRSGRRIRSYFESISSGVAEYASRICEGHWLDFDVIDDYTSYPTDASIHCDNVNVKALTIYVRMIDLLDMGEDRTPYILWKFVAPRNKFSKLEWAKHRALQPVTFPQYQLSRYIQVDGSTDDQNVYMSIMDLKRYVDNQFRQCCDILNRINHSYHKLNISHIDWRIAARGFEPVTIQFEFDRNRMFDILGDEIYQGNPYVFIRELLQNAIDAIEMRTEILDKKDLAFKPKIHIDITESDLNYIVQITDNGIGMDEYIIRNYLAVAGKSYYRSVDFQKECLKMDPISRFGIGVLSCFMVSDYIEIDTYKDPNTTQKQEHLKISIPSKENYFKIKKNTETLDIGTTFRVFVIKNKLPKNKETGNQIDFNITEYIKRSAGFVKYSITVKENGIESLIINPNKDSSKHPNVYAIDYHFPFNKAILPQNIEATKEYFIEKTFHLKTDLKLKDFDGCITYLLPKSEQIDIANDGHSWPISEIKIIDYFDEMTENKKIKWQDDWVSFSRSSYSKDKTTIPERCYSVFMDGILLQDITPPEININKNTSRNSDIYYSSSLVDSFVNPQLLVNIPKPIGMKIDLARTNIETDIKWDYFIWKAFFEHLKCTTIKEIESKNSTDRLLSLAKLITFYKLSDRNIIENLIDTSKFPLPFISNSGTLTFHEFGKSEFDTLRIAPVEFSREFYKLVESNYLKYKEYSGVLNTWRGFETIVNLKDVRYVEKSPASLSNMSNLIRSFINKHYYLSKIEFITSPLGVKFPLAQEILKIRSNTQNQEIPKKEVIRFGNLEEIDDYECTKLNILLKDKFSSFPTLVKFSEPYDSKMFYSFKYINLSHALTKDFINICLSLIIAKDGKTLSKEITGKLFDMINDLSFIKSYYSENKRIKMLDLNLELDLIFSEASKHNAIICDSNLKSDITVNDFVENSITFEKSTNTFYSFFEPNSYLYGKKVWGKPIK